MADGNLFTRPDTFFGVCEAIGEDLGFDPLWLRIALGVTMLWQPVWTIVGYLAVGVAILALRLILPNRPIPAASVAAPANDAALPAMRAAA